jgi:hypothetical protein
VELKKQPGVGRSDLLMIPLDMIEIDPAFNVRTDRPELAEHIRQVKDAIAALGEEG